MVMTSVNDLSSLYSLCRVNVRTCYKTTLMGFSVVLHYREVIVTQPMVSIVEHIAGERGNFWDTHNSDVDTMSARMN